MKEIDKKIINNIRGLCIDMINKANSGHPGIALGAAPILYTLFSKILKIEVFSITSAWSKYLSQIFS